MARKSDKETPRNVLIVRFSALGDVCMTIPVVYAVCRANPEVRFIYLTKKPVTALFIGAPSNLTVVGVDLKKDYTGPLGAVRLAATMLHRYSIDAVADLHSVMRTHIMDALAMLRGLRVVRIDKMRRQRQELISRSAAHAQPLTPMIERYAAVFEKLGLAPGRGNLTAPVLGAISPSVAADVLAPKAPGKKWIAIAPFAAHRGKIYPLEKMEEVAETLATLPDTTVILFGAPGHEAQTLDRWVEQTKGSMVNMAGKRCGFHIELSLIAQCDIMLSMDSANMHLASLMGTPVVSIWGATHPAAGFSGWRQDPANAVQASLPCRPCSVFGNKVCHRGTYECLSAIAPQQIIEKVKQVIGYDS